MWGSLSLGSIRDAAAKIKDGLEAQMEEAVQQSGPKVTRSNPMVTSPGATSTWEQGHGLQGFQEEQQAPPFSAGSMSLTKASGATSLLSPLSGVPGLQQLPSRLGTVVADEGEGGRSGPGVDGAAEIDEGRRGYSHDPADDATVQRRPCSPPPTNSTGPGRNTPASVFFENPFDKDAASEDSAPAVVRFSVDEGVIGVGEKPQSHVGGLLGVQEAFAEGGGRDAKPSVAGEGWGDIALDSDDDVDLLDTTASGPNGTVVGVPDAGGAGAAEQQQARSSKGLQDGLDRDSSAAEPKARADEAGMTAATATVVAASAVLPLPAGSGAADGGGLETVEGQGKGKEDREMDGQAGSVTEMVPMPCARGSEEGHAAEVGNDARFATAAAAYDVVPDAIAQSSSANGGDGRASTLPEASMPPEQAGCSDDYGYDGEEGNGCAADPYSARNVDPSRDAKERGGREPLPEGEAMPATVADAVGRKCCQGEEGQLDNAKDMIAPDVPNHASASDFIDATGVSTGTMVGTLQGRGGEDVDKELVPTSAEAPGVAGSDQHATDEGVVSAYAAGAADATGATYAAVVESFDLSPELEARRRRAAAAAERRREAPEHLPAPTAELSTNANATEVAEERSKAHRGGDRREKPVGPKDAADDKMREEAVTEGGQERAVPNPAAAVERTGEKTGNLAAALAASREREDALTARLLVAEELLAERERQLESTNISMAEIMQSGGAGDGGGGMVGAGGREDLAAAVAAAEKEAVSRERREAERAMAAARERHRAEVSSLEGVLEAERKKAKAAEDAVKGWERRAEEFEQKDKMLKAYMEEGQALAYKQSEMEKSVRKARGSLRGVTEERDALAKEKQALEASLAGLREQLRARDEERATQTQSLAAMGAVSQASSQKLTTMEKEFEKTREALSAKKAALDKAWGEIKELKRSVAELKADKGALNKSLEDGGRARQATEWQLKEWQARENSLLLEQGQLQETLERVRREADRREEEANRRQEDVRRRWKDAVARAEALQAEAHESTAPLLRQIRALQEEMRLRQEAVRAAEVALTERASLAEQACREADRRRRAAEATAAKAEENAHQAEGEVETLKLKAVRLEASNEELKGKCERYMQRVSELEGELSAAKESSKASALAHKATESKLRLQVSDAEERLEEAQRRADIERWDAKDTATTLREQIEEMRRAQAKGFFGPGSRRDSTSSFSIEDPFGDGLRSGPGGSGTPRGGVGNGAAGGVGVGVATFAEVERLQSLARQKEGQVAVLQQRLEEMQAIRDALTEEVTSLGRRNTELEALAKAVPLLRDQAIELQKKNMMLLDLLGEKTEELEAMQSDMKEVQNMYRAQYNELFSRASVGASAP